MLEVIIELTAAESNIPYVVSVLPFSAVTLSGTTLSNTKLLLLLSVIALFTDKLDTTGELCSGLPLTSSISKYATASGDLVDEHSLSQYNWSFLGSSFANECETDIGSKEP